MQNTINALENQNGEAVSVAEMQREIRALKRRLALAESNIARAQLVSSAQDRVETIWTSSLKKELQFFKLVLENTTNILWLFDFDCRFAYASQTFLTDVGIPSFGLIGGRHFVDVLEPLISTENLGKFIEAIGSAIAKKHTVILEDQIDFNAKGSPRTFSIHITPMTDDDGRSTGIMALFLDITEINDAMETAKRANMAKSDFLANMSHEIRTPMNAIIGMTAIGKSAADTERKDYCLAKIEDASIHLLGVINDVLDMSKIEANKFELTPTEFDFEHMLRRVVNVVSFRVDEKRQAFTVHIGKAIPKTLIGDDQRLAQVITNLLGNAVKFTPDRGSINLDVRLLGEENGTCTIQISIKDTGIGMSPEQQARLFKSFQQAESSTTRKYGGTGLGLAISKRIVEMMGGRIWVESALDEGATFVFTVQLERGEEKSANPYANVRWSDVRILAVDDDPRILAYFEEIVRRVGAHCDTAQSGEEALALVRKNGAYPFYFVDWKVRDTDSIRLASALKATESAFESVAVIMTSSTDWSGMEEAAKAAGVDKFLSKPLFPSAVVELLMESLGAKPQKEEIMQSDALAHFAGSHILLAEDVEVNREIVLAFLGPLLLEIDCAENGAEAVRTFGEAPEKYRMILMDVQMPEMDGYEATRRIRALDAPCAKTIPIIAMTANVFREDVERCLDAGMNDHIGKPLDFEEVLRVLQKYLPKDGR